MNTRNIKLRWREKLGLSGLLLAGTVLVAAPALAGVNAWTTGGPDGVNATAVAVDPSAPQTVYAATENGVLLRSSDGGTSWNAAIPGLAGQSVRVLAVAPSRASTIYALNYFGSVLKTDDRGTNWRLLSVPLGTRDHAISLAVDPSTAATVYAGTLSAGVLKSTDGGETWAAANSGLTNKEISALAIDPSNPSTIFAAIGSYNAGGVFKSTDRGQNWKLAALGGLSVTSLAINPVTTSTIYCGTSRFGMVKSTDGGKTWAFIGSAGGSLALFIVIDSGNPSVIYAETLGGLFKSSDEGRGWAHVLTGPSGNENFFAASLAIIPSSPSVLLAAARGGIARSSDGAANWTAVNAGVQMAPIAALAVDPFDPLTVYAGSDSFPVGGVVFKSTNGGERWTTADFGSPSARALAVDPSRPSVVYAAAAGVSKSTDGGTTWRVADAGLDHADPIGALAVAPSNPSTLYAGNLAAQIYKSLDGADHWTDAGQLPDADFDYPPAVTSLVVDPADSSTAYVGSDFFGLFKTTDGGATWKALARVGSQIFSLAIDPRTPTTVFTAADGSVVKSTDGGASWVSASEGLGNAYVRSLVIDPSRSEVVYAGSRGGGVFQSVDGGAHWTSFNDGLTDLRVTALAIDQAGKRLHVGTAAGGVYDRELGLASLPCAPGPDRFCLLGGRFEIGVTAVDPAKGVTVTGQAVPQGDRFGYFSIPSLTGDPTLPEITVKMADATSLPPPFGGSFWVFYNGLNTLRYKLRVADTATGKVRIYEGEGICGGADTSAFPGQASGSASTAAATTLAAGDGPELLLRGGRFRVSVLATDPRTGVSAPGAAIPQRDLFGYFSLPDFTGDPSFPEVFIKMTAQPDGSISIFHSGLTDLSYTLTITDTGTGVVRTYKNDSGDPTRLCGGADTSAFPAETPF